jgi:hypothetical protein
VGSYSVLTIGRASLAWKYEVPAFLTFLFEDQHFYSAVPPDDVGSGDSQPWLGYRTTVGDARERLDRLGFTLRFFGGVYETLLDDLDASLLVGLGAALTAGEWEPDPNGTATKFLSEADALSTDDQIAKFVAYVAESLAATERPDFLIPNGESLLIDPEEMASNLVHDPGTSAHPAVVRVGELLSDSSDCPPEIRDLFLARALLETSEADAVVDLDLTDVWDGEEDLAGEPTRLAQQLVRRVQLYNRAFSVLTEHEVDVRRRAARLRIAELVRNLEEPMAATEKGPALEDLVAEIFETEPGFRVAERRYNIGDQELDLVVRNHVDDPFWQALGSPLILVECKNWSSRVGTNELRNFETKLRDHPMARVGFFVALNGVTREATAALHRATREAYRIVVLTLADLNELVQEEISAIEWLTKKLSAVR